MSLRKKLVKLAYQNEDLRPHLLPLLKEARGEVLDPGFNKALGGIMKAMASSFDGVPRVQNFTNNSFAVDYNLRGMKDDHPFKVTLRAHTAGNNTVNVYYFLTKGNEGSPSFDYTDPELSEGQLRVQNDASKFNASSLLRTLKVSVRGLF